MSQSIPVMGAPRVSGVAASTATDPAADRSGAYAADWRAPAIAPPLPVAPPRRAANDAASTAHVHESALLAADVYNDVAQPPPGFSVASDADLRALGVTPAMLEQPGVSTFRARVYVTSEGGHDRFVVAMRGSSGGEDWRNNGQQALGLESASYAKALAIGRQLARSDADVGLTGHSLGGGLAAAAALASGRDADTFNAAGLSSRTIAQGQQLAAGAGRDAASVQAYHVQGEILTMLQNGGDRAIGSAAGGMFGPLGRIGGAVIVDAPEAYGVPHRLPDVRPEGKTILDGFNPIDRHGMDWVLAGTAALR